MLLAVRDFIQSYHRVSDQQLCREFSIAKDALFPILALWIKKGRIREAHAETECGPCRGCRPQVKKISYYEWCEPKDF